MTEERWGSRRVAVGVPVVLLVSCCFAGLLLLLPDRRPVSDVVGGAGLAGAALVFTVLAARRSRRSGGWFRRGWALLAAAGTAFAAGQAAWASQQLQGREVPYPSWAEVLYLLEFPLAAAGVLCLADGSMRATSRVRTVADGLLLATALLILSWDTALLPVYLEQSGAGPLALGVGLAFPLAHVVLLTLIGAVAVRSGEVGRDLAHLAAGVAASAVSYAAFAWLTAGGGYFTGHVIDSGWVLGFGLLALAALGRAGTAGAQDTTGRERPGWALRAGAAPSVVPVASAAAALALTAAELVWGGEPDRLHAGSAVLLGALLLVRQWLSLRENADLTRVLEQRVRERTAELAASRARYQSVLDSVHEVIFQADLHGRTTFLSRAWSDLTGIPAEEAVGRSLDELVHPGDVPAVELAVGRLLLVGRPVQVQLRLPGTAGAVRWMEAALSLLRDAGGTATAISGTLRDVSDRRRAEEALRESEERWRLLLESTGEGIFGMDLDGRCTFVNAAAAAMIGRPVEEVLGRGLHDLIHHTRPDGSPYPAEDCPIGAAVRTGRACHVAEEVFWRADGSAVPVEVNARPVVKDGQVAAAVLTVTDITSRRAVEQEVRHRALHDPLTDLPNRTLLADRLEQSIATSRRTGHPAALMVLDLDGFKDVNDRYGHLCGDELLREVAARLTAPDLLREVDTVARLGGDEFAVVLPALRAAEDAEVVAGKILAALGEPVRTTSGLLRVGCSLGIAVAPGDAEDARTMLQRADVAMYLAKGRGGGAARYQAEHDRARLHRLELADELRAALETGRLHLHYQPVVELRTGDTSHVEALCRWESPTRGSVPAEVFVDVAEEAGLIGALTAHVLDEAHRQSCAWRGAGLAVPIAVNISPSTLHDPELLQAAYDWRHSDPPAGPLEIEVTESAVMAHPAMAVEQLQRLAGLGVRVSIDDFGTGYSSLAQLRDMPVHAVKIDRRFLSGARSDGRDDAIVESVVKLGHILGLTVIAEGVEDAATAERLSALGCDQAQGWHFGRPRPAGELTAELRERVRPG
ncbi:hypothetical protein NUM3379_40350 [Kineococcus sp. NUM-3379]